MRLVRILIGLAVTLAPAAVLAQPTPTPAPATTPKEQARALFDEGSKQYNLGNFVGAIESFKKAYELDQSPAYLFNLAQAYRQTKDCINAKFGYQRFLDIKDADTVKPLDPALRAEVVGRIAEMTPCAEQQEAAKRAAEEAARLQAQQREDAARKAAEERAAAEEAARLARERDAGGSRGPRGPLLVARVSAGGALVGAGPVDVPLQFGLGLQAGYPLALSSKLTLEPGAALTYTPIGYVVDGMTESSAQMGVLANLGVTFEFKPKLAVHGDVGAGMMAWSGLKLGNQFTTAGGGTSGALAMLNVRLGAGLQYAVMPNVLVHGGLAFAFSPPKAGLRDDISLLTNLAFTLGAGVRL